MELIVKEAAMELTWKKTLAIWWSLFWRGTLLGFLIGALFGGVLGGVMGAQGYPVQQIQVYARLAGYVGGLIASLLAVKFGLQKHLPSLVAAAARMDVAKPAGPVDDRLV